jgi:hypothetical protein
MDEASGRHQVSRPAEDFPRNAQYSIQAGLNRLIRMGREEIAASTLLEVLGFPAISSR